MEDVMDEYLYSLGIFRKVVAKDGSSVFRTVSEQLFFTQVHHFKIREYCADFIEQNKDFFEELIDGDFYSYLEKIRDPKEYAGILEINALAMQYKKSFRIYQKVGEPPAEPISCGYQESVVLCCTDGIHYDSVYPRSFLSASAICQSIIYEVLYKKVFKFGDCVDMAVSKMLHDKAYSKQRRCHLINQPFVDCNKTSCDTSPEEEDAGMEIKKALAQGIPPFPYKVAKALDPHIYRNVEFDLWNETKKEQLKCAQLVTPEFAPGVKCIVHLEGHQEAYTAYVQEVGDDKDLVTVYVEELCKRHTVPLESLEILAVPAYKAFWQGIKNSRKIVGYTKLIGHDKYKGKKKFAKKALVQDNSSKQQPGTSIQEHSQTGSPTEKTFGISQKSNYFNANQKSTPIISKWKRKTSDVCFYSSTQKCYETIQPVPAESNSYNHITSAQQAGMISRPPNSDICATPTYVTQAWGQMSNVFQTPPIAIPARPIDNNQMMHRQNFQNPPPMKETDWSGETCSLTGSPNNMSPIPLMLTSMYPCDAISCILPVSDSSSQSCDTNTTPSLTSSPSQILAPTLSTQSPDEICIPAQATGQPVTIYPYNTVYSGMILMYNDGSSHPVNVTQWRQDYSANDISQGIPGVYYSGLASPPGSAGVAPQMTQWIPNYSPQWPAGMQASGVSTFATPQPGEMNYPTLLNSPPWTPHAGYMVSPSPQMAYQIPTNSPHMIAQQSMPSLMHPPA